MRNVHRAAGVAMVGMLLAVGSVRKAEGAGTPAPYSLPWQLRPAAPSRVLRLDTVGAFYEAADGSNGTTFATLLLASARVGKLWCSVPLDSRYCCASGR